MDLVKDKLEEWNLLEFYPNFEREGIDEESFQLLDSETLTILIPKAGPRLKFKANLKRFLTSVNPNTEVVEEQESSSSASDLVVVENSTPRLFESCISRPEENSNKLDLSNLIRRKMPDIFNILREGDQKKLIYYININ